MPYQNTITKGGVYYGLNMAKISSRFSQETIGIKIENSIQTLIKKGKNLDNNFSKTILIKPSLNKQKIIQINVYTSNQNENLNENDFIGRVIIYLENNKNKNAIKFKINYDVVLTFRAYELESGKEIKTKFEYFK